MKTNDTYTILVAGSGGMLARDLIPRLEAGGHTVSCADLPDIDITSSDSIAACMDAVSPDFVINCAAYTAVDKAESDAATAFRVNRDGPANIADACADRSIPLVHISTDFVFDGNLRRPYREDDAIAPLSVYGLSKWEGEEAVRARLDRHVIVRTAWLYGQYGGNFVKTMLRLGAERDEIRVIDDQHGSPTWSGDFADALVAVAERIESDPDHVPWGTYHFCGNGQTTWYGFAYAIFDEAGQRGETHIPHVVPVTTGDYPTPATRPAWSVLDTGKITRAFGVRPLPWRIGLQELMNRLYAGDH